MTTTDFPAPPEPGLTAEEVVRRAEEIAPSLVERQAETEKRTYYAPDTHELFSEAGFYRILVPRRYGGYEFGIETFLGVSAAPARGCPSTGWMFSLGAAHTLIVATLFGEQAQAELFSSGEFICPATVAPSGTAVRTGGGWTLEGTWNYCSGSPYATHFLGHTLVPAGEGGPPAPMAFVIPRSEWTRLDDWGHYLGLKGSGSHSIRIERGYVPDHFTLPTHIADATVDSGTPGLALHRNPQYAGGQLSFMFLEFAALAVGITRGALDAYEELLRTRTTFYPPIIGRGENADYQTWHGSALGALATAEAALESAGRQWADLCTRRPGAFGRTEDLKLAAVCGEIIGLCWRAVEQHLFRTAGSGAIREGQRIERAWRDLSMMHSHAGTAIFLPTEGARALSQAHLGIETAGFSTR
ncbi:MAG TPA: acyl-CoA dehydrogenase family protein [Amycolatopsis sp.]|nr:acyl-CoA dehydrogenase family protein [Amycolatopsis sp.]